jgi:hypothetical protein
VRGEGFEADGASAVRYVVWMRAAGQPLEVLLTPWFADRETAAAVASALIGAARCRPVPGEVERPVAYAYAERVAPDGVLPVRRPVWERPGRVNVSRGLQRTLTDEVALALLAAFPEGGVVRSTETVASLQTAWKTGRTTFEVFLADLADRETAGAPAAANAAQRRALRGVSELRRWRLIEAETARLLGRD